jgi:DNA-directed RNA polymerase beta subunit
MERIMCGPISYAAECHLSAQKIRARDHGQNDRLGRQPVQGKQNNGALKNGTLEQVALLTHGVSNLIKDHYGKNSSDTVQYNCTVCHRFDVYYDALQLMWKCPTCGNLKPNQVITAGRNHSLTLLSQILNSSTAVLKGW